jgi:NAD-dependent SIR2 family protein deacetylase
MNEATLNKIRALIASADGLIISAGAGMGVDSGLPDFRGNEGMWEYYPALGKLRIGFSSIANPQAFAENPERAWGFYGHRLMMYRQTEPHLGFRLLKELGEKFKHGYFVFTSNVDGQFQKAGFDPEKIHECHGSIHSLQCMTPNDCSSSVWPNLIEPRIDTDFCELVSPLPKCKHCGELARPSILMFNDWHWQEWPYQQQNQRLNDWLKQVKSPLVIEIGAGVAIPTVRYFSEEVANGGERLIRINPANVSIRLGCGVSLTMGGLAGIEMIFNEALAVL